MLIAKHSRPVFRVSPIRIVEGVVVSNNLFAEWTRNTYYIATGGTLPLMTPFAGARICIINVQPGDTYTVTKNDASSRYVVGAYASTVSGTNPGVVYNRTGTTGSQEITIPDGNFYLAVYVSHQNEEPAITIAKHGVELQPTEDEVVLRNPRNNVRPSKR